MRNYNLIFDDEADLELINSTVSTGSTLLDEEAIMDWLLSLDLDDEVTEERPIGTGETKAGEPSDRN